MFFFYFIICWPFVVCFSISTEPARKKREKVREKKKMRDGCDQFVPSSREYTIRVACALVKCFSLFIFFISRIFPCFVCLLDQWHSSNIDMYVDCRIYSMGNFSLHCIEVCSFRPQKKVWPKWDKASTRYNSVRRKRNNELILFSYIIPYFSLWSNSYFMYLHRYSRLWTVSMSTVRQYWALRT